MNGARKREDYAATLAAPHATSPTEDGHLYLYAIRRTPKRVSRSIRHTDADIRLFVPPAETWTLDTLRMVLWELARFLPEAPFDEPQDVFHHWVRTHSVVGIIEAQRVRTVVSVETATAGASMSYESIRMTAPMRTAIETLPREPFPLAAITDPGAQAEGDDEPPPTNDSQEPFQRLARDLKKLDRLSPGLVARLNAILDAARERFDLDDDDE